MADIKLKLPPFAALRAFYAAAMHPRFRDAANSLGVTESAISHQIKRLEDWLRVALIDRSGSGTRLTEAGRRYFQQIEPALLQIQAATDELRPVDGRSAVRLTLPPSLAANWLIPKFGSFERAYPNIDLQLLTSTRVIDLRREQVDLAIRHGRGTWRGLTSTFLLEEAALPVCAPGYLVPSAELDHTYRLEGARLIINGAFPDEWNEWARARDVELPAGGEAIILDAQEQTLQLAENGHGIAMGRRPVVDTWLSSGRLIAPFGDADPTGAAYYLCKPAAQTLSVAARRTERWLTDIAAEWRNNRLPSASHT
ncbi:MAG: LysR substrate-binding domain-containing protein [Hyphomicrobiaceae bacterium]